MDYYTIPILTGLLAWLIAWLFVKLLFWPKLKGLETLLNQLDIALLLNKENSNRHFDAILPTVNEQLNDFFSNKLSTKLPMIALFIGEKTIAQLKDVFVEELRSIFPVLIQQLANKTKEEITNDLDTKWISIFSKTLLKATLFYRIIAFFIGCTWGVLMVLIIHHVN